MNDPVRTYIETKIKECKYSLEKEYQTCPGLIKITSLESRLATLTEVLHVLENKNAPEAATSKGKAKK